MKKVAIIQARMGSTRFPGKVLKHLLDKPLLEWVVNACQNIPLIDEVIVATTTELSDAPIVEWCNTNKIKAFRGNESDVLSRYYEAAKSVQADIIMRITADCPLLDPHLAGQVLYFIVSDNADYACNVLPPTWPDGLDCEAFTFRSLEVAYKKAIRKSDREHVTPIY